MEVPLRQKSEFDGASTRREDFVPSRRSTILYRAVVLAATLAAVVSFSRISTAQMAQEDTPEVKPSDKKVVKIPLKGEPRALGLLLMSSTGKTTVVPIAIRVDGKFYDAAAYKANPVPMSLDTGTVYEGLRSGASLGLFTVSAALHSEAVNAVSPWIGTGVWLPTGTEAPKTGIKAEDVPVGIETTDEPPRLTKGNSKKSDAPAATPPAAGPAGSTTPSSSPPPAGGSAPNPDPSKPTPESSKPDPDGPPKLSAPPSAAKPTDSPTPTPSTASSSDSSSSNSGTISGNDNNRPRLRRGKPVEPLPEDEVPGYSKLGSKSTAKPLPSGASMGPVQVVTAISDAGGPDPHTYAFEWRKDEEEDRRKQMLDLAKTQLKAYVAAQAKNRIGTPVPGSKSAVRKPAAKAPEYIFENVQMHTYDPWLNNQPVILWSADAHLPLPAVGAATPGAEPVMQYTILLAGRTDIYNNMHKLYSAITDKYHLDVSPKLELIDVVDVDGDGRGEFLFRETSDTTAGYVVYRPTGDTLWKMFDSLNPL